MAACTSRSITTSRARQLILSRRVTSWRIILPIPHRVHVNLYFYAVSVLPSYSITNTTPRARQSILSHCLTSCIVKFVLCIERYVLAMAYSLVMWGTFKKVKISFLPVGHTHDDCDQCFSCLNKKFKTVDMMTLPDLTEACKVAYPGEPQVVHLDNMANWTSLFEPIMVKNVRGISKPRCFLVRRDGAGVVRHYYRQQMQTSKGWFPENSVGHRLLEAPPDLTKLVNVPFKPIDEKELQLVEKMAQPFMTPEQRAWWRETIEDFVIEDGNQCEECVELRRTMIANASSKNDSKEEARTKGAAQSQARADMLAHLENPSDHHSNFEGPTKPVPNFRWVSTMNDDGTPGGHYEDEVYDEEPAAADELELQGQVDGLMEDYIPNHHVGTVLSRDRDRPANIETGMVVILRRELEPNEPEPPDGSHEKAWFVGEVTVVSADGNTITVHEWGNPQGIATTGVNHDRAWTGESYEEKPDKTGHHWVPKDMYMTGKRRPAGKTNRNFRPKICDYPLASVVDYGSLASMVQGNRNKVKPAVLNAIDSNPNVLWKRPSAAARKRKNPSGSSQASKKHKKNSGKRNLSDVSSSEDSD
jgi:hypothetical protein